MAVARDVHGPRRLCHSPYLPARVLVDVRRDSAMRRAHGSNRPGDLVLRTRAWSSVREPTRRRDRCGATAARARPDLRWNPAVDEGRGDGRAVQVERYRADRSRRNARRWTPATFLGSLKAAEGTGEDVGMTTGAFCIGDVVFGEPCPRGWQARRVTSGAVATGRSRRRRGSSPLTEQSLDV